MEYDKVRLWSYVDSVGKGICGLCGGEKEITHHGYGINRKEGYEHHLERVCLDCAVLVKL